MGDGLPPEAASDLYRRLGDVEDKSDETERLRSTHEAVCAERMGRIDARFATFDRKLNLMLALIGALMLGMAFGPQAAIRAIAHWLGAAP